MPRSLHAAGLAVAVIFLASVLAGCGTPPAGTPAQILRKAIDAQGNLKSVTLSVESEMEYEVPGGTRSQALSYKGSFEKPDSWKLTVRSGGAKSEVVIIGERTWVKLPGTTTWTEKNVSTPLTGAPPSDVVAAKYLKSAKNVKLVDQKDDEYHLSFDLGMLDYARAFDVSGIDPEIFKGKSATMEVWVRKKDLYLTRVKMTFATHLGAPLSTDLKMNGEMQFKDFNEPVSIEPPV